jgi:uncharacterized protein YndB with AHSA1/START domain
MSDKIKKTTTLKAPVAKVWNAISDSAAFGAWFGVSLEGPFVEGQTTTGAIVKTQVDDEVAKQQEPYVGMRCDLMIERIVPLKLLAFRWHPGADPDTGPNAPTTLVTFELEEVGGATRLTITESGFEGLPLERRAKAFADNEGGWEAQLGLIAKYLERQA